MTWRDLAIVYPEFVQWAVATHGPLPDGEVDQGHFTRLAVEYNQRSHDEGTTDVGT